MTAQVLLLRGINVGGHGKLPMADLRALLIEAGAGEVRTYIQSGNAVLARAVDPEDVAGRIAAAHGFRPGVFALSAKDWRARMAANPFREAEPKSLHAFFFDGAVRPETAPIQAMASDDETIEVTQGVIWLRAPSGIGRSKLAAGMEKLAGRPLTARNGLTLAAISGLVADLG